MQGFQIQASMWTMNWDHDGAERAIAGATKYNIGFIEIPLIDPPSVDAEHTRDAFGKTSPASSVLARSSGSCLGIDATGRRHPSFDRTQSTRRGRHGSWRRLQASRMAARMNAPAAPPTQEEYDNVTRGALRQRQDAPRSKASSWVWKP